VNARRGGAACAVFVLLVALAPASAAAPSPALPLDPFVRPYVTGGSLRIPGRTFDGAAAIAPGTPILDALGDSAGAWTEVPPPRRYRPHLLCDSAEDRLLLVDGSGGRGGEVWELSLTGSAPWRRLPPFAGQLPPLLEGASSTEDREGRRLVIFGGRFESSAFLDLAFVLSLDPVPTWRITSFVPGELRPIGREQAAVAVDPDSNRLVVFGGFGRIGPGNAYAEFADVWTLDLGDQEGWSQVEPAGPAPAPRRGATLVHVPGTRRFLLYGGHVRRGEYSLESSNELWELRLDESPAWTKLEPTGDRPGPMGQHAAFWDAGLEAMVLYSAWEEPVGLSAYDPATGAWSHLDAGGTAPTEGAGRAFAHDRARDRWLFFGLDPVARDPAHVDVLTLSPTAAWSKLRTGDLPQGRFGHATVLDPARDRMIVFGGVGSDPDPLNDLPYLADPWSLALDDLTHWTRLAPTGTPPTPRHEPVGVLDSRRDRALFFGGWRYPDDYRADVWELSLGATPHWSELTPAGEGPVGRRAHAAVLDPLRERMLVFAGAGVDSALDDLWAFELAGPPRWVRLEPAGPRPSPRWFPTMTYDAGRDRVLVFGGGSGGHSLPEVWELSLGDLRWTLLPIAGYPVALERHGAIHDPARDRLLVFGGWEVDYDVLWSSSQVLSLELDRPLAWRGLRATPPAPRSSIAASFVADPRRDRAVLFGGGGFTEHRNDVWALDFVPGSPHGAWVIGARPGVGRVELAWGMSAGPGAAFDLERREEGAEWSVIARLVADARSELVRVDEGLRPGWRYGYRLRPAGAMLHGADDGAMGELTVTIPGGPALQLLGARPNPATPGQLALWYALADPAGAVIELLDVRGRRLWHRDLAGSPAGAQVVRPEVRLAAGLYFSRLRQGRDAVVRRVVVTP
jgi:hypothetical protein